MRKYLPAIATLGFLFFSMQLSAQTDKRHKDTSLKQEIKENTRAAGKEIKEGAEKVGDKTAEIAVKGASTVTDKVYQNKTGPNGQTIFIDEHSKYYWVNEKGKKVYISADQLKDKKTD